MRSYITIVSTILFLYGCGSGASVNQLVNEASDSLTIKIVDTNYIPKNLISSKVVRAVDPSSPPIEINLQDPNSNYTKLDVAQYFKSASVKILEYPADSGTFVNGRCIALMFNGGMQSFDDVTKVRCVSGNYLVYDNTNGLLQYDSLGKYVATIHKNNLSGLKYDKRYKYWKISIDRWNSYVTLPTLQGNIPVVVRDSIDKINLKIWNLAKKKIILEKAIKMGHPLMNNSLNDSIYYKYRTTAFDKNSQYIMLYFFNSNGDTLSKYTDYIRLSAVLKQNYVGAADKLVQYKFNGDSYLRQPYSDTVFRIVSPTKLHPAYLIEFGDKKLNMDIGYYGKDKSNYFTLQGWSETKDVILITYSKNYDCPNTRDNKTISFYYAVYDKTTGNISYLDMKGAYPQEAWVANTLPNSLPIFISQLITTSNGQINICYFKEDLENMLKSPSFAKFPITQQNLIKQLVNELGPRKIAVMSIK